MKSVVLFSVLVVFLTSGIVFAKGFPIGPDPALTPGSLCDRADQIRYPEKIKYCNRNVETQTKWQIIFTYNEKLGYNIRKEDRQQYKIDHFIPLCMGGSNHVDNLWPQHQSIYNQTDPIEAEACAKMSEGKLQQRLAVDLVREAKLDLSKVKEVLQKIRSL